MTKQGEIHKKSESTRRKRKTIPSLPAQQQNYWSDGATKTLSDFFFTRYLVNHFHCAWSSPGERDRWREREKGNSFVTQLIQPIRNRANSTKEYGVFFCFRCSISLSLSLCDYMCLSFPLCGSSVRIQPSIVHAQMSRSHERYDVVVVPIDRKNNDECILTRCNIYTHIYIVLLCYSFLSYSVIYFQKKTTLFFALNRCT